MRWITTAREWLVRAQGHARLEHEESLAEELRRAYELRVAEAIEASDGAASIEESLVAMRKLVEPKPTGRGN